MKKKNPKPTKRDWTKLDIEKAKSFYGGQFPKIKGKNYRYPKPENEQAWMKLIAAALTYKDQCTYCYRNEMKAPVCKYKAKYEYILYHARPEEKKKRHKRNIDRRENGLKKGDTKVVHHTNPQDLHKGTTKVLTHCEHMREHGWKCKEDKNKNKAKTKTKTQTQKKSTSKNK